MEPSRIARWTLVASILGSSMAFIDGSVVNVALPSIQADLGGGLATQQWVVDAYLLTLGSLILVGGSLGDIFGELKVFTIGVASFAGASILCAIAPTAAALIVFRGVQGMAGALLVPASLAMLTSTFSGTARGNAIGQWTSWTGISFIIGPTFGGWLIDVSSWRTIFLLNIPIAAGCSSSGARTCGSTSGARSCARPGWLSSSPASSSSRNAVGAIR
jgi:MFS family permease